jgi:acetoin utilization deacetylase AcuC-like enzyme
MQVPKPVSNDAILRAHSTEYLSRLSQGNITNKEIQRVGLPWSPQIIKRTRYSVGVTVAACRAALSEGFAANLGGGTHHAFHDQGQGFCWLNDSVIAARAIQAEGLAKYILIVDCYVHQGNGTAAIVNRDPTIFTFSTHGKNNFPHRKETSDLDVELSPWYASGSIYRQQAPLIVLITFYTIFVGLVLCLILEKRYVYFGDITSTCSFKRLVYGLNFTDSR